MARRDYASPVPDGFRSTAATGTSQEQQSLHLWHFSQRWFAQVSFVQQTQMSVEGSPQMLHTKIGVSLILVPPDCSKMIASGEPALTAFPGNAGLPRS